MSTLFLIKSDAKDVSINVSKGTPFRPIGELALLTCSTTCYHRTFPSSGGILSLPVDLARGKDSKE